MMKKMDKKAFTLIELLVVIAVVGILVLLGAPRFTGYTQRAELTRIQHDTKMMEQEIGTELINGYDEFNKWENNIKDLNQLVQEDKLFDKKGPVTKDGEPIDGSYKVIPEEYKDKINTKLKGAFYANSVGKVYYEHVKSLSGIPTEPEEEPVLEGPIPIATAEELNNIRNATIETYGAGTEWEGLYEGGLDKEYIQVANIDLSEYSDSEEGWSPIGTEGEDWGPFKIDLISTSFKGTYDGGNYVITGLEVKGEDERFKGLFGFAQGATIRNVGLIDNKVIGREYVGGLVGAARNNTTISNSYATGSVEGTGTGRYAGSYVGGLMGRAWDSTIKNSYATGSVIGKEKVGGLVGGAWDSTEISHSYATGSVEGSFMKVGGLVGEAQYGTKISNSYATVSVTGEANTAGGLVGDAYDITIDNSYSTGSATGRSSVGGLVGTLAYTTISNSYATGSVESTGNYVGGLVGHANIGFDISNSYWDTVATGQEEPVEGGTGLTTEEMKKQSTYSGWDFDTVWKIDGNDYPKLR